MMKTWRYKSILILIALMLTTSSWFTPLVQAAETGGGASQFSTVGGLVYDGLTSIGGTVASLGGTLFDMSLSLFVLDMAGTVEKLELNTLIENTWKLIRDIFNLLFIFSLIFIGFQILLEIQDSQAKRQLGMIVITALLINFSLYITRVVIDFGNIAAAELRESIVVETDPYQATVFGIQISNISSGFIAATDLPKLKDSTLELASERGTGVVVLPKTQLGLAHALALGLTVALMLMLVGFVLAAGALMMLGRFFYLTYMMMLSPLMFLGWVLPKFKSYSKGWWGKLVGQTLIGPIFILMLIIALRALQTIQKSQGEHELNTVTFLLSAIMVAGFTWAALVAAQKAAAYGADQTMGFSTMVNNSVRGFMGRNTIGRAADSWNRGMEERGVSEQSVFRRFASTMANSKYGGSASAVQMRTAREKASQKEARYNQIYGEVKDISRRRTGGLVSAISTGIKAPKGPEGDEARINMERAVSGSSNEQVMELIHAFKPGTSEYAALVGTMSASQFDSAMKAKSDELDDKAKSDLSNARTLATQNVLREAAVDKAKAKDKASTLKAEDDAAMQEGIKEAKDYQLKALGVKTLIKNAAYLKQSQFDEIMKSKDYTPTEQRQIKEAREEGLKTRFNESKKSRDDLFKGMQDKDIASLPKDILLDLEEKRSVEYLTGGALKKIAEDDKLAESDREELRKIIGERRNVDAKSSAIKYLKSPQGQEKYGEWGYKDEKPAGKQTENKDPEENEAKLRNSLSQ